MVWKRDSEDDSGAGLVRALIQIRCEKYVDDGKPQKTDDDKKLYKLCCEENFYCSVWAQAWFWYTIGGVILFLIILSVLGCVWCCCLRKRGGGGSDEKDKKSGEVEEQNRNRSDCDSSESSSDSDG
ncbi:hypothetical protein CAEBREN_25044 [Caenorhabditis brenneri]|uniref:Uncharacterized protein n=1 Tax=Caenorhabditis brenneri TaxID=135651 RepID=G0MDI3_CAEBE|nr:hypothetical protein CAEBREN_25044 [Caenorhabditis brenneri]